MPGYIHRYRAWAALGLEWTEADQLYAEREIRRSVRHIAQAAPLLSRDHLLLAFDELPRFANVGSLPTMERLISALNEAGHLTARVPDLRPFIATLAPFEAVIESCNPCNQPNEGSLISSSGEGSNGVALSMISEPIVRYYGHSRAFLIEGFLCLSSL